MGVMSVLVPLLADSIQTVWVVEDKDASYYTAVLYPFNGRGEWTVVYPAAKCVVLTITIAFNFLIFYGSMRLKMWLRWPALIVVVGLWTWVALISIARC